MARSKRILSSTALIVILTSPLCFAQEGTKAKSKSKTVSSTSVKTLLEFLLKKHSVFKDFRCTIKKTVQMGPLIINATTRLRWKASSKFRTDTEQLVPMLGAVKQSICKGEGPALLYRSAPQELFAELDADSVLLTQDAPMLLSILAGDKSLIDGMGDLGPWKAEEVTEGESAYYRLTLAVSKGVELGYEFDKHSGMILRAWQSLLLEGMKGKHAENPLRKGLSITITYEDIKTDTGLEDSDFVFKAPKGAKKIDPKAFRFPGMPGMPGFGSHRKKAKKKE